MIFRDLQDYQSGFPIFANFQCLCTVFCFNDFISFHFISVKLQGSEMSFKNFFRPNLNGFLSEFRGMMKISKIWWEWHEKYSIFYEIFLNFTDFWWNTISIFFSENFVDFQKYLKILYFSCHSHQNLLKSLLCREIPTKIHSDLGEKKLNLDPCNLNHGVSCRKENCRCIPVGP